MNKKKLLIIIVIILIFILGIIYIISNKELYKDDISSYKFSIITKGMDNCNNSLKYIYHDNISSINYYTYCLDNYSIIDDTSSYKLYEVMDDILNNLILDKTYKDGSILYRNRVNSKFTNELKVLVCNNKYYIGNNKLTYKEEYCKEGE